ncbi:hypothetical protein AVEN_119509-1, partial [Araneus ventricosus]
PGQARVEDLQEGVAHLPEGQQAEEATAQVLAEPSPLLRRERQPEDHHRRVACLHQHHQRSLSRFL